jgi:hypothetical protein
VRAGPCSPELVQDLHTGALRGQCRCGWFTPWARPTVANLKHLEDTIDAHRPRLDPVVRAKLDELIETGNEAGVDATLVRDLVTLIATAKRIP